MFKCILLAIAISSTLCASESATKVLYFTARKEFRRAIDEYLTSYAQTGTHDFDLLQELGSALLDQGVRSSDFEVQLLSLYGISTSRTPIAFDLLEKGMRSEHPYVQAITIQLIGSILDDRVEDILSTGLHSNFLMIRFETLFQLAARKSKATMGNIDSLINRLPHEYKIFFPDILATLGTPEAISALKATLNDAFQPIRLAGIIACTKHHVDELLPSLRASITHPSPAEQEACASALGALQDLSSVATLKRLATHGSFDVRLAALRSLVKLGYSEYIQPITQAASAKQLFAISTLSEIEGGEKALEQLIHDSDFHVRLNACLALLLKKNPACASVIEEILFIDDHQIALFPYQSIGFSLHAWKTLPLAAVQKEMKDNLKALSFHLQSEVLKASIDLPEEIFLKIATRILHQRHSAFIPLLIHLIEQRRSDACIELLKRHHQEIGSPLIRNYCNLSLYRMGIAGPYRDNVLKWISEAQSADLIRFRPMADRKGKATSEITPFTLTPEETSSLLIESFETIAVKHEPESIISLLKTMQDGNEKNRHALAGLLLKALQ